jgi:hypothetical protein
MKLFPAIILFAFTLPPAHAQPSFASGSNGSDGALNITGAQGTVITFDPKSFNPPLNPAGDNIFNFTTINIDAGVTLRLSGRNLTGPIYWLASGAVTMAGTIDLSGESGSIAGASAQNVLPSYPGAGGFAGGPGGSSGPPNVAAQPGSGPLGGAAGSATANGQSGGFTGNTFLIPLVGGSGGGGQYIQGVTYGAGGSAGGGALMIASSTSISITGIINANGGNVQNCGAGGGAGGAIRLSAPVVSGSGSLSAVPQSCSGAYGRVRIETGSYQCSCFINAPYTVTSTPNLYLPTVQPGRLHVTSIGGVTVPASPTGSFSVPDTVINTGSPVSVVVQASQIPPGTTVTLQFVSENTGSFTATTSALAGSLTSSNASASVTFPPGFTRGYATASW